MLIALILPALKKSCYALMIILIIVKYQHAGIIAIAPAGIAKIPANAMPNASNKNS
jgi:hypothetical protein